MLPTPVEVEKNITPAAALVLEPVTVQFFIVLPVAPLIKRMVEVPAVADVLKLEMVRVFPPVFNPSRVTLSAPFNEISGRAAVPETILAAPPAGEIVRVAEPVHWVSSTSPVSTVRSEVISAVRFPLIPLL